MEAGEDAMVQLPVRCAVGEGTGVLSSSMGSVLTGGTEVFVLLEAAVEGVRSGEEEVVVVDGVVESGGRFETDIGVREWNRQLLGMLMTRRLRVKRNAGVVQSFKLSEGRRGLFVEV